MTLIDRNEVTDTADHEAIAALRDAFERQRRAFLADPLPSLEERRGHLEAVARMIMALAAITDAAFGEPTQ